MLNVTCKERHCALHTYKELPFAQSSFQLFQSFVEGESISIQCVRPHPLYYLSYHLHLWKKNRIEETLALTVIKIFSRESESTIANVCPSVSLSPKPLSLSELLLSTIEPINHQAYQPLSLSTIKPIDCQAH